MRILLLACAVVAASVANAATPSDAGVIKMTARAAVQAYQGNSAGFDLKYNNKVFEITGPLRTVASGPKPEAFIVGIDRGNPDRQNLDDEVHCTFDDQSSVLDLVPNTLIHVRGVYQVDPTGIIYGVDLYHCELLRGSSVAKAAAPFHAGSVKMTARAAVQAYEGNSAAFDLKYKNRVLEITGPLRMVVSGAKPTAVILGIDRGNPDRQKLDDDVHCTFDDQKSVVDLVPDTLIHVRGVYEVDPAGIIFGVDLYHCRLLKGSDR